MRALLLLALATGGTWLTGWAVMPSGGAPTREAGLVPETERGPRKSVLPKTAAVDRGWDYIVIHHSATAGGTLESIRRGHRERLHVEEIGYHFIINNGRSPGTSDGELTPTSRWLAQQGGAHCAVRGHPEFNARGIGICLIGHFDLQTPTPRQMACLERLVTDLRQRYGIPLENIFGHGELKATDCPGRNFPMEAFLWGLRANHIEAQLD